MKLSLFTVASAALTFFSVVHAQDQCSNEPSCTNATSFVYAGCFQDPSSPRALPFSGPSNSNMTVETCVAFCKANNYKYAGLEYYQECFCGASVNGPQVSESMCSLPCSGDNTETCGGNDYLNVYQDTTFPTVDDSTISDYVPMGCYSEGTNGRALIYQQTQLSSTNLTVEECLFACKDGGYSFAGVEYASQCYCGVVLGNGTLPLNSTSCNMPCTGDSSETCGGSSTLNLYVAKDLESTQMCTGGGGSSSLCSTTTTTISSSSQVPSSSSTRGTISLTSSSSQPPSSTSTVQSSTSLIQTTSSIQSSASISHSSAPAASTLHPSTSCTSTKPLTTSLPPPTTSAPPTTLSTKTSASLCTSTTTISPTPTCEYKCGSWCSTPIPEFSDHPSCLTAVSACELQVTSCFLSAGFPSSLSCMEFSSWCSSISSYCGSYCPGGSCNRESCKSKNPPSGPSPPAPTVSTIVYTCPAATAKPSPTSSKISTTTCVPVPTNSNVCTQPSNSIYSYSSSSPVGGIALPCLTCNNLLPSYNSGYPFKLYTDSDTSSCSSYERSGNNGPWQGCRDACDNQYTVCLSTYAEGCRSNLRGETYSSATTRCHAQWNDCYSVNSGVTGEGRCGQWNEGW